MYYLRQSEEFKGVLTAKVDNDTAGKLIREGKGEWKQKRFQDGTVKTVFEFAGDFVFTLGGGRFHTEVQLMIWNGAYLYASN